MRLRRNRGPTGRNIQTIGVGMFGVPLAALPSDFGTPALWLEATPTTVFRDEGTIASGNGEIVKRWNRLGSAGPTYAQSPDDDEPLLSIASSLYFVMGAADKYLALSSAVALTGDFLLYAVVKWNSTDDQQLFIASSDSGTATVSLLGSSDTCSLVGDNDASIANEAITNGAGAALVRIRRVGSALYIAKTGFAEATMDNADAPTDPMTLDAIIGSTNIGYSGALTGLGALLIYTDAGLAASPPAGLNTYFLTNTSYGKLAPWGVSL